MGTPQSISDSNKYILSLHLKFNNICKLSEIGIHVTEAATLAGGCHEQRRDQTAGGPGGRGAARGGQVFCVVRAVRDACS